MVFSKVANVGDQYNKQSFAEFTLKVRTGEKHFCSSDHQHGCRDVT